MKTLVLTITLLATATTIALSQGKKSVVIGTMIDRPNAVLVINPPNKDQGFLLPQLTTAERNGISPGSPQDDGLVVYDVTDKSFYYWSGGSWIKGLGDNTTQTLAYDPATQTLSLSNGGGNISLSTLKEVPSQTGQGGKYLTTDGTTLSWVSLGTLGDITSIVAGSGLTGGGTAGDINLAVNTDGTTISVNGSNQLQLSNGAVTTAKLATGSVNSSHIIDGTVSSADILDNTITATDIAAATITGAKIANSTVTPANISGGGNDKVLTTDAAGVVNWADRSTFVDDNQNLGFSGSTLTIDNGSSVTLTTSGQVSGQLNALVITPGTSNQVMTTNAAGTATVWTTPGGDVTGPVNTSTVGKIQGRDISSAAPNLNDGLIWNGTAWAPGNVAVAVAPTVQYYAVDPAAFQPLEPTNSISSIGLFESNEGAFVFAKGKTREIVAPVNLPHGATIQSITVFYEYTTILGLLPFNIEFDRKPYAGGNQMLWNTSPLLSVGTSSIALPGVGGANAIVDNSVYTYRVHVTFNNVADTDDVNGLARIYGIRIQYLK